MTTTREAKTAEILKAHRAAARVAKTRKLSPAFDADCREAERRAAPVDTSNWTVRQHVMFGLGYLYGRLRNGGWFKLLLLAGMAWGFIKIAPFLFELARWSSTWDLSCS